MAEHYLQPRTPRLQQSRAALRPLLVRSGYRFEYFFYGGRKVGLWRKPTSRQVDQPQRLLVVPGFGDSPMGWMSVLGVGTSWYQKKFDEVVIIDWPGFTGWLWDLPAIDSMEELQVLSSRLFEELKPSALVGHSLGGWLVAKYLEQNSEADISTVLVAPSGVEAPRSDYDKWRLTFDQARDIGFETFRPKLFRKEPAWFSLIADEVGSFFQRRDILRFMESVQSRHLVGSELRSSRSRINVLWGQEDQIVPIQWLDYWRRALPADSSSFVLTEVGHSPHFESPLKTSRALYFGLFERSPILDWMRETPLAPFVPLWEQRLSTPASGDPVH